jgi:uncharacterized protein YecE (DUF72 family)
MVASEKYIVGTSGYSFPDWVGGFYPAGTRAGGMFDFYARHFGAVELNFSFYRMPAAATMLKLAKASPDGFGFWVKAYQDITHKQDLSPAREFLASLAPLRDAGKLAGVLMQFPQSFHRTPPNRQYLARAIDELAQVPTAIEFRHATWDDPATVEGMGQRNVTLVIPDVPALPGLYRPAPAITSETGYLRLHSRNASNWYAGMAQRYDYSYSARELGAIVSQWETLAQHAKQVYAFFNNCHGGQAAQNAEAFRKMLGQIA